jgi:plastocyanin
MSMIRLQPRRFGLAFLTAILMGGCSSDQDRATQDPTQVDEVVGRAPGEARGFPSVVMLHPLVPTGPDRGLPTDTVVMDQFGMQFVPEVLRARPGQPVAFTNSDAAPHLVSVRAEGAASALLDEATDFGTRLDITFDRVGAYDVSCGMHPGMAGIVLVSDAAYTTAAGRDGAWRIPGVPPGSYLLDVWSADATKRWSDTIQVGSGKTTVSDGPPTGGER